MASTKPVPLVGLRGAQRRDAEVPPDVRASLHSLVTIDGATIDGTLYARCSERTVCCLMHPREILATHQAFAFGHRFPGTNTP